VTASGHPEWAIREDRPYRDLYRYERSCFLALFVALVVQSHHETVTLDWIRSRSRLTYGLVEYVKKFESEKAPRSKGTRGYSCGLAAQGRELVSERFSEDRTNP
jgi:hypothetical protein